MEHKVERQLSTDRKLKVTNCDLKEEYIMPTNRVKVKPI